MSQKFACTLVDQIGIQIYDQIWILRTCSKGKLRQTVSIGLGLKGIKIAWNVAKVGVHACLSNMHPNIWSGLNSKNLVKAETASCSFVRVCLKDGENSSQHRESWRALLFSKCGLNLWLNSNFEKLVKRETSLCSFAKVGLKGGENILECLRSLHACLLIKLESKFMINFKL